MRQPFEIVSSLMTKLDLLLVTSKITYEQWVDAYSVFISLGWTEKDFVSEVDRRWAPCISVGSFS